MFATAQRESEQSVLSRIIGHQCSVDLRCYHDRVSLVQLGEIRDDAMVRRHALSPHEAGLAGRSFAETVENLWESGLVLSQIFSKLHACECRPFVTSLHFEPLTKVDGMPIRALEGMYAGLMACIQSSERDWHLRMGCVSAQRRSACMIAHTRH